MTENPRGAHHIEAVVHHFLSDDHVQAMDRRAAEPHARSWSLLRFIIAGAASERFSSLTAACLALASAPSPSGGPIEASYRVTLAERHDRAQRAFAWASILPQVPVFSHLCSCEPSVARDAAAGAGPFREIEAIQPRPQAVGAAGGPVLQWLHWGCVAPAALKRWETSSRGKGGPTAGEPCQGLVWCLDLEDADSLRAAYSLGRLREVTGAGRVKILLFAPSALGAPANASDAPLRKHAAAVGAPRIGDSQRWLRCRDLNRAALPQVSLEVLQVSVGDSPSGPDPGRGPRLNDEAVDLFQRLAGSLRMAALPGADGTVAGFGRGGGDGR